MRSTLNYYRSTQPSPKSPFQRGAKQKKRRLFSRLLDWLAIALVLAGLVYGLLLRASPDIAVSSSGYRSADAYKKATETILKSLKNRNKLTFDENGLASNLKKQFPEINSVKAELPLFGQTPTIRIDIAEPSLMLRGVPGTIGGSEQLVIDSKGMVIGPSSNFKSISDLPIVTDESGFAASPGQAALSQSEVSFIVTVVEQVKNAKVPIASLALPKLAQQLDLRTADRSYFVKFYLGGDALIQSGQFLVARAEFDETNKQPSQYLDVRVNGKVYYK